MSTRPGIGPQTVIPNKYGSPSNGSSMATNITSAISLLKDISLPAYTYSWTGTSPVGTLAVQVSNDYSQDGQGNVLNAGTWNPIYFQLNGSSIVNSVPVTGNTGIGAIDVPITGFYAIRTVYTATSGTGTLTAIINAKVS